MKHINDILIHRKDPNDHIISIDPMKNKLLSEDAWEAIKKARKKMVENEEVVEPDE